MISFFACALATEQIAVRHRRLCSGRRGEFALQRSRECADMGVEMSELYEIMNAPGYELAQAKADRDEWKRRYDTACAHVEVDCEEAAKEAVAEMKPQLEKAKADVAALKAEYESRAIWIAKMCAILDCENKDGFHCKDVHEEARKLKADVARLRGALEKIADWNANIGADDVVAGFSRMAKRALAAAAPALVDCPHCGSLTHLSNCPDSHCEPDPRNSTAPAPVDDAGTVEGTLAAAKAIVDSGVLDRVLGKPAPVVPLPDMNSSTTEPSVSSKDFTVPLEDAEALAKQLELLNDESSWKEWREAKAVLRAFRAKHPAPVAQACDAH